MPRPKNLIPSEQLNVALPLDVFTKLSATLYSPLEGRVPYGAFSRFFIEILRERFDGKQLDLAPFLPNTPAGVLTLSGSSEAVEAVTKLLKESSCQI